MGYRDWHVGMKVVCIDDSDGTVHRKPQLEGDALDLLTDVAMGVGDSVIR